METIKKYIHEVDAYLWRHGFRLEKVRFVVRTLFLLNLLFIAVALISLPFSFSPLSFCLASLLASYSFYSLAKHVLAFFPTGGSGKVTASVLLNWFARLIVVLTISLLAIILLRLPPFAWFVGLGVPVFLLPLGFFKPEK